MVKGETSSLNRTVSKDTNRPKQRASADAPRAQRLFENSLNHAQSKLAKTKKELGEAGIGAGAATAATEFRSVQIAAALATDASTDAQMTAHIERIAAAIAEVTQSGASAEVQLTLPASSLPVDGAIIGRDANGALHVMLTSPHEIPAAQAAALQSSLHERLRQRDLRVAKLAFQKATQSTQSLG